MPWYDHHENLAAFADWMADNDATGREVADMLAKPWKYDAEYRFRDEHSDSCIFGWVCKIVECYRCHEKTPDCKLANVDLGDDEYPALCEECRKKVVA